jgi:hypothetical protein
MGAGPGLWGMKRRVYLAPILTDFAVSHKEKASPKSFRR